MVHVMTPRPSIGAALGQALGAVGAQQLNGYLNQQQQLQQRAQLNDALSEAQQLYSNPNLTPEQRTLGLYQALRGFPDVAKNVGSQLSSLQKGPTPYQEEDLALRKRHLDIQENRLNQAREKGHKQLPELLSRYTKTYTKDLGISPEDKIELDKNVQQLFEGGDISLQDAFQQAVGRFQDNQSLVNEAPIIERPARSPSELPLAMDEMVTVMQDLYDRGAINQRGLRKLAMKGKWQKPEIDQMIKRVLSNQGKKQKTAPVEQKPKVVFNPQNPEHVARARQVLEQVGGDRAKANSILAEEFNR